MRVWLKNQESTNILWIIGAPGAGKSTIAATMANELKKDGRPCAKFFAKRDIPDLQNPRRIFTSIAYSLAERHDGLKTALMIALAERTNVDAQDDDIFDQFQKLIKAPLLTDLKETASGSLVRTRSRAYPLVIIDALDECYDEKCQISLLESLANWPDELKLIITSRYDDTLSKKLGGLCHCVDLTVGNNASLDSRNDIGVFFATKFGQMRLRVDFQHYIFPPGWPEAETMQEMIDYAAGLFIWADMVISYVVAAKRNAGYDPVKRLKNILDDIRDEGRSGLKWENRVENMYARIIFEALPDSRNDLDETEKISAKQVLAAILLAKEPLQKEDLVELTSTVEWDSHNTVTSTLLSLKSIIPSSVGQLRLCHKSVSDFLLSKERSSTALSRFVPDESERNLYVINTEEENKQLALACLRLMQRKLSSDAGEILIQSQKQSHGFTYARQHWIDHLKDAGGVYHHLLRNLKSRGGAIKVARGRLEQFKGEFKLVKNEADGLVRSICSTIDLATRCIDTIGQGDFFAVDEMVVYIFNRVCYRDRQCRSSTTRSR